MRSEGGKGSALHVSLRPADGVLGTQWVSAGSPHLFRCNVKGFRGKGAWTDKKRMCQPSPLPKSTTAWLRPEKCSPGLDSDAPQSGG
jgi:hypothetical protein